MISLSQISSVGNLVLKSDPTQRLNPLVTLATKDGHQATVADGYHLVLDRGLEMKLADNCHCK